MAKAEVNLMSLLSTLDDITAFQCEEQQQEAKESNNTPKVPRTNSLEDLGIKVLQSLFNEKFWLHNIVVLKRLSEIILVPYLLKSPSPGCHVILTSKREKNGQ